MMITRWLVPSTALLWIAACNELTDSPKDRGAADGDASSPQADSALPPLWELDVADYDRSCRYNTECQAVAVGPCRECMCPEAAINRLASQEYWEAYVAEATRTQCFDRPQCWEVCDWYIIGRCERGRCEPGPQSELDMSGYGVACATVDDCVAVNADLCDGESCTGAIAKSERARYEAARAAAPRCGTSKPVKTEYCTRSLECREGRCTLRFQEVP